MVGVGNATKHACEPPFFVYLPWVVERIHSAVTCCIIYCGRAALLCALENVLGFFRLFISIWRSALCVCSGEWIAAINAVLHCLEMIQICLILPLFQYCYFSTSLWSKESKRVGEACIRGVDVEATSRDERRLRNREPVWGCYDWREGIG